MEGLPIKTEHTEGRGEEMKGITWEVITSDIRVGWVVIELWNE